MWKGRFAQDTDEAVINFTQSLDLDWRMAFADIRGSVAHVRMLAHTGLLDAKEAETIEENLRGIAEEIRSGDFTPKVSLEDVHMNIESRLIEKCGATGARLHMGRSRNDQVNTTVRLYLRKELLGIWEGLESLISVLIKKAEEQADIVVPGYTHLQQAQPISMGQFWMAHAQAFMRDAKRLLAAYDSVDESPLGCGALAGSTLPLDREFTRADMGFSRLTENSMDTVAHRDHFMDILYFAAVFGGHVSRLSEDLIIYFTTEFGWVKLPDSFCTGSSIMPQKKNPDVLEILRGKSGQLSGALVDLLTMTKGIPLTYNRDLQDDKRSLFRTLDCLNGIFSVLPALLSRVEIDEEKANRGFADGLILATDVAEYLVLRGVPFRSAHEKVGHAVRWCIENNRPMDGLTLAEWQRLIPEAEAGLLPLLSPRRSMERRDTVGGTSPRQVRAQIARARERLAAYESEMAGYRDKLPDML
ncbi:argininosuccinate lyase [Cloacibacillus evryensis]|uniref:argininosuccinate lyase n=1 Tax=Cloacibacillus evryensis TaxID=508460 RepID=UPI002673B8E3|nr:argininosuccinate lyase [Cloacibacillus evryensis]